MSSTLLFRSTSSDAVLCFLSFTVSVTCVASSVALVLGQLKAENGPAAPSLCGLSERWSIGKEMNQGSEMIPNIILLHAILMNLCLAQLYPRGFPFMLMRADTETYRQTIGLNLKSPKE